MKQRSFARNLAFVALLAGLTLTVITIKKERPAHLNDTATGENRETKKKCAVKNEQREVRGKSLSYILEEGEYIKILRGFYDCYDVRRDDVVAYAYAGRPNPIIKVVRAMPGDTLALKNYEKGTRILVNGKELTTSKGEYYELDLRAARMLKLYVDDYGKGLPENAYLILGNIPNGSLDSSRFGLVSKTDFLGKVVK